MDVKTVCLGMLTDGPASGYDLKKHFESSFRHFFAAGYGSIYPALSSLAESGHVSCEHVPQDGKPDRKVYAITASGRAFLLAALQNPNPCHKVRSEFLATMCFAHLMSNEQVATVLQSRLDEIDSYRSMFDELERCGMRDWPQGKQFVVGFARAITEAADSFIKNNQHTLTTPSSVSAQSRRAAANGPE